MTVGARKRKRDPSDKFYRAPRKFVGEIVCLTRRTLSTFYFAVEDPAGIAMQARRKTFAAGTTGLAVSESSIAGYIDVLIEGEIWPIRRARLEPFNS